MMYGLQGPLILFICLCVVMACAQMRAFLNVYCYAYFLITCFAAGVYLYNALTHRLGIWDPRSHQVLIWDFKQLSFQ